MYARGVLGVRCRGSNVASSPGYLHQEKQKPIPAAWAPFCKQLRFIATINIRDRDCKLAIDLESDRVGYHVITMGTRESLSTLSAVIVNIFFADVIFTVVTIEITVWDCDQTIPTLRFYQNSQCRLQLESRHFFILKPHVLDVFSIFSGNTFR